MRASSSLLALAASSLRTRWECGGATVRRGAAGMGLLSAAAPRDSGEGSSPTASGQLTLAGVADTLELGAQLAGLARVGDVVLLHGDYGAGKTCLARGFIRRWYADPSELVTSPSYLIDNVYDDPDGYALLPHVTVHHMDLWRLPEGKISQLVDLPSVFAECVSLIEWPQRLGDLAPQSYLDVRIAIVPTAASAASDDRPLDERAGADDDVDSGDDDEQPRLVTLTAKGERWVERLPAIVALFADEVEEEDVSADDDESIVH